MKMIDKLEKALSAELLKAGIHNDQYDPQKLARAAIEAMREPTKEMIQKAYYEALGEDAAGVWREMIDEALASVSKPAASHDA